MSSGAAAPRAPQDTQRENSEDKKIPARAGIFFAAFLQ